MSDTKELVRQHAKAMAILIMVIAMAVTLLSGGLPRFGHSSPLQANVVLEAANVTVISLAPPTPMQAALENSFYLLILASLVMVASHMRIVIAGRMPKSPHEEKLLEYILLAREKGFNDVEIMVRLVQSGWGRERVERVIDAAQPPPQDQRKL